MKFSTFFFLLFIFFISLSLGTTFFPEYIENLINFIELKSKISLKFLSLLSLISSIVSYLGIMIFYLIEREEEKVRVKKLKKERENLQKIHAELEALQNA